MYNFTVYVNYFDYPAALRNLVTKLLQPKAPHMLCGDKPIKPHEKVQAIYVKYHDKDVIFTLEEPENYMAMVIFDELLDADKKDHFVECHGRLFGAMVMFLLK